ncbi:PstS family phosphate ABC transporter substrate-binding protein [Aestuariispira insulae]|nr:substrate-binding domain-containing protein [Aestuariispira insulae]
MIFITISQASFRIGGTGADLGTMRQLAKAYSTATNDTVIKIVPKPSLESCVKALLADDIQIAISDRPPTDEESKAGILSLPYARTALVFATGSDQAGHELTPTLLKRIYSGQLNKWPGGGPISLIMHDQSSPVTDLLLSQYPELWLSMKDAYNRPGTIIATSNQDMASRLERLPGSIGTISLSAILGEQRGLHPLPLNGIAATPASIANNSYPVILTLYFLLGPEKPNNTARPEALNFIRFVHSPRGRIILGNTGHQSLSSKPSASQQN